MKHFGLILLAACLAAGCGGCSSSNKPRNARQAPKPATSMAVLDQIDPPDVVLAGTPAEGPRSPARVELSPLYEAHWQVIDGKGRWIFLKVADQPRSPNLQPALVPQEVGLVTAECMRTNAEVSRALNELTADAAATKTELARLGKERAQKLIEAKRRSEAGDEADQPEQQSPQRK